MPKVGALIADKYRLGRELGAGGFGVVFAATHVELQNQVAIKFLAAANPTTRKRFVREARACVKLRSEHVGRVIDVGEEAGSPYIVLEFLEGHDLRQHVYQHGPLPVADACEFVVHACHGLAEAHARGIVHRDMKPANLFLTRDAHGLPLVKVLDFGISKVAVNDDPEQSRSMTAGVILGTPQYMSPEQIESTSRVDHRTDIWSLGITLYELLGRSLPFQSPEVMDVMTKVTYETAPRIEGLRKDVPKTLGDIIERCLSKSADKRFSTCAELAKALEPFAHARAAVVVEKVALLPQPAEVSGSGSNPVATPPPRRLVTPPASLLRDDQDDDGGGGGGAVSLLGAAPPALTPLASTITTDLRAPSDVDAAAVAATVTVSSSSSKPRPVVTEEALTTIPFQRPPDAQARARANAPEVVKRERSSTRPPLWFLGAMALVVMATFFVWLVNRNRPVVSSHAQSPVQKTEQPAATPTETAQAPTLTLAPATPPSSQQPSSVDTPTAAPPPNVEPSAAKATTRSVTSSARPPIGGAAAVVPRRPSARTTTPTTTSTASRGPSEYPPTRD